MKKRMLCLLMAMVVLLLPLLLAACNDPNYMGALPPAASGGQEGGEKLSEKDPQIPDLTLPEPTEMEPPEPEPGEKYSEEWFDWLALDGAAVYDRIGSGSMYGGVRYSKEHEPSSWEIWPYTDYKIENGDPSKSHFHLLWKAYTAELKGFADTSVENYGYTWTAYYKYENIEGAYTAVTCTPWSYASLGDAYVYRLNFHAEDAPAFSFGLDEQGETSYYRTFIVITDEKGQIVGWQEDLITWSNSSEAYYQDAIALGLIDGDASGRPDVGTYRKIPPSLPEPAEKYSEEWLEWLTEEDDGYHYTKVTSGGFFAGIRYDDGKYEMEPSAWEIWPYTNKEVTDKTHFHLCVHMKAEEFDGYTNLGTEEYEFTWRVYYRLKGSEENYRVVDGCLPWSAQAMGDQYLYRLSLHAYADVEMGLGENGSENTYEMLFLIFDSENELVVWYKDAADWTDSSEALYQDALELGVIGKK